MHGVGGCRGSSFLPEGREGRGWRIFAAELGKVVAFFDFAHSGGSSWQPSVGRQATGMGNSSSAPLCKEFVLGGPFFATVLGGLGKPLNGSTENGLRLGKPLTDPLISFVARGAEVWSCLCGNVVACNKEGVACVSGILKSLRASGLSAGFSE